MFLDDWEDNFLVCVVSLDNFPTTTVTPSQYDGLAFARYTLTS